MMFSPRSAQANTGAAFLPGLLLAQKHGGWQAFIAVTDRGPLMDGPASDHHRPDW